MKSIIKYSAIALAASFTLLATGSCTRDFEKIHDFGFGLTEEDFSRDGRVVGAGFMTLMRDVIRSRGGWDYQVYQNLNADVFSGYMATPSFPNSQLNYRINNGWNDNCWNDGYAVMRDWYTNYKYCIKYGFPDKGVLSTTEDIFSQNWKESIYAHFLAINTVCKVLGMSRIADQYGPIIYSTYGKGEDYDSVKAIYTQFFAELKEAVEVLDIAVDAKGIPGFARYDIMYGGDYAQWARLANSLRLRLAMRIVSADPAEAQKQFEAALVAPRGVMKKGDNYTLKDKLNYVHFNSHWTCSVNYNDMFISANTVSILGGYNDPRLPKFAMTVEGKVQGIRTGLPDTNDKGKYPAGGGATRKDQYIKLLSHINVPDTKVPMTVVYAAETQFLLAEAALRGWNVGGGTAQSFYEQGIADSFDDWGVAGAAGYAASSAKPADFKDALYREFDIAAVSTVTPKWDDATTNEERLEKIITQKWIAMFPEGMNAWAEYRRTGYPKQFPIMDNQSQQGAISTEHGVRRLTYTVNQNGLNKAGVAMGVGHLGGPDSGATRLWWDKADENGKKNNF